MQQRPGGEHASRDVIIGAVRNLSHTAQHLECFEQNPQGYRAYLSFRVRRIVASIPMAAVVRYSRLPCVGAKTSWSVDDGTHFFQTSLHILPCQLLPPLHTQQSWRVTKEKVRNGA
jgi:hypothetical protein